MYLNGGNSVLNGYNCSRFRHGCPNSSYFTDEVYKRNLFENGGFFFKYLTDDCKPIFLKHLRLTHDRYIFVKFSKYHIVKYVKKVFNKCLLS